MELGKRTASGIMSTLLLIGMLILAFSIQRAPAGSKLTGDHESLDCFSCHIDAHKPQIDRTICRTCHQNKWDLVQEGSHEGGSAPFEDYCVTCHDPHHPDYFWNLTKKDWIPRDAIKSEISKLCYQCHTFSPEEIAQITDFHSMSKISEPAPPLLPPLNLSLVLVLEIIIIAATIILSMIQSARQKKKWEVQGTTRKPTLS